MSSRGKKKTTFAKLNREARLRERREDKQSRKRARREASGSSSVEAHDSPFDEALSSPPLGDDNGGDIG